MLPGGLCALCASLFLHNLGQGALLFPASFLLSEISVFHLWMIKHFKILNEYYRGFSELAPNAFPPQLSLPK